MTSALLALLLALQDCPPHGPAPGARAAVVGLPGIQIVSRLDFGSQQNRLTAVYVFPDRVRWHFENYSAEQSEHLFLYRWGESVQQLASGSPSQAVEGMERNSVLLQMELRRAVMLWPDGFAWQEAVGGERTAAVHADSCCRELPIGTLVAELVDGRPRRIQARDPEGRTLEALEIRVWEERNGRNWPRGLVMEAEGGGFVETVESIETRLHYLEPSFVPPDRRPVPGPGANDAHVLAQDLVPMTYCSYPLPQDITWEQALAQARLWIAETGAAGRAAGRVVDPVPTFELSSAARPQRCLVRLMTAMQPAPEGFETQAERPGFLLPLQQISELDSAALARLQRAVPENERAGSAYVRVHARPKLPIEVVLPLAPAD
ncbi:MAG: hypothetical protein HOP15_14935 [Planctomycetes bacterium]|nr:hypothetical protein [Planctomycetota bacterium]